MTREKKKKILIDLDILTVSFWNGVAEADNLLERVKKGEFELFVPYIIFDSLSKWKYSKLSEKIRHFYEIHATRIITLKDTLQKIEDLGLDDKKIVSELEKHNVKREDITLVIITSIFNLPYLVTYNRKHLTNNESIINEVLKKNGLKTIKIILPDEI